MHRSSSVSEKPKLMAKQLSLPSDILGGRDGAPPSTTVKTAANVAAAPQLPKSNYENGGADEEDTASVTSDILPEGQDEQAGCVLS